MTVGNLEFTVGEVDDGKIRDVTIRIIPEDEQTPAGEGQEA